MRSGLSPNGSEYDTFPFLEPVYAELRYLVTGRERLVKLRDAGLTRLKSILSVTWPEFEDTFRDFKKKTPLAVLERWPTPTSFLSARRSGVLRVMRKASRGHCVEEHYDALRAGAEASVALPGAQSVLDTESRLIVERTRLYTRQIRELREAMERALDRTPEGEFLLTIPKCAPVTAAVFLGMIGNPRAYSSSRQILSLAGLQIVSDSSGVRAGRDRLSKRGRPTLRKHAFMFAMRNVRKDGLYRAQFDRLVQECRRPKKEAIVILERKALRMMYRIARERRPFTLEPPDGNDNQDPGA
jgi:hypothetical protein